MASLIGMFRVCRDAELRYTALENKPVTNLTLVYNYGAKGDDNRFPSQWVEAELWGPRAESLARSLVKGIEIYAVIDDAHVHPYTRSNGEPGTKIKGRINQIRLGFSSPASSKPSVAPMADAAY